MTVFEPSEARIKVAAMMEDYPGAITPEKAEELIAELEVEFAKIDQEPPTPAVRSKANA